MKVKLFFLFKLAFFSVLLFLLQDWIALAYQLALLLLCSIVLPASQATVNLGYESSLRIIPFISLMLATPRMRMSRRLQMTTVGLGIFVFIDLASILIWKAPPPMRPGVAVDFSHILYSLVWDMLGHWLLPFLLWIIAVHREIGALFSPKACRAE